MQIHGDWVENEVARLAYMRYGNGSKVLLAFHGFGINKESMKTVSDALPEFTVFAFDLFFHGESIWKKNKIKLSPAELGALIQIFLSKENIFRFSLLGYSMGARYALSVVPFFQTQLHHLILLAPDGFINNIWFSVATSSKAGRLLFKLLLMSAMPVKALSAILAPFNMWQSQIKFAVGQLTYPLDRSKVYHSWLIVRLLKLPTRQLKEILESNDIELIIFVAQYDRVVTADWPAICKFLGNATLCTLPVGHSKLLQVTAEFLKKNKI